MYTCICGKTYDKANSLNAHYSHCIVHRNGIPAIDRFKDTRAWATGKTKESNSGLAIMANKNKGKHHDWTIEQRKEQSIRLTGKTGGYRENSNRWKGLYTDQNNIKVWLDSTYELRFVNLLNSVDIQWIRNYQKFQYSYNGHTYNYIPDFYLPALDIWVEVKGWSKEKDLAKWNAFPYRLIIIKKLKLEKLELIKLKSAIMVELVDTQDRGSWLEIA
jgi:hypothetical protein